MEKLKLLSHKDLTEAGVPREKNETMLSMIQRTGLEVMGTIPKPKGASVLVRDADWRMFLIRRRDPKENGGTPACRDSMAAVLRRLERIEELLEIVSVLLSKPDEEKTKDVPASILLSLSEDERHA